MLFSEQLEHCKQLSRLYPQGTPSQHPMLCQSPSYYRCCGVQGTAIGGEGAGTTKEVLNHE